ncbi:MAG: GNAT family N-acetyltransferase [Clostridia bacterium]|nr:GNAT family N-acetyltransferase [Clostridia bacterium]
MKFTAKKFSELGASEVYEILKARMKVFLLEQNIVCLDIDDVDYESLHCFLEENGEIRAYLRAFYSAPDTVTVGRVLSITHGVGDGKMLMEKSLLVIEKEMPCREITLHSQTHAAKFYEKFGFETAGEEFLEEGVPHILMRRVVE